MAAPPIPVRAGTWRRRGTSLVRNQKFRDFEEAMGFGRVADGAVDHEPRPDLCTYDFNRVRVTIANQHRGALTQAEMRLPESAAERGVRH